MPVTHDPASVEALLNSLSRTTEEIFSLEELKAALLSGTQLVMKYGADVTAPTLHLGHAVNLWMYREMQQMGHKVVFLVGDFTTRIGDPTGKNKTRPIVPEEEIRANAEEFIAQVKMVLIDDPEVFEIRRNSEWFDRMSAAQLLSLMSTVTHDRLLSRDMFRKRIAEGSAIYEHELIYPLLQGYDSVVLNASATIIGSDQLFNEMMGRALQERYDQKPQVIITSKITPGIDGKEKQSKSLGNYIGLSHSPRDKFGRVMSIADSLIVQYLEVYTKVPLEKVREIERSLAEDPMGHKLFLAHQIVARYHGESVADAELAWFRETFSAGKTPEEIPQVRLGSSDVTVFDLLRACFTVEQKSNSELRRLLAQGAVTIEGEKATAADARVTVPPDGSTVKVGKRNWFKVLP